MRTLDAWMVMEVPFDGPELPWTRHLIGWRLEGCKGQVSSPVDEFDPVSRRAVTRTGRVYELGERPGVNADAFATWSLWRHRHGIQQERDISDDVEALIQESMP